jgi:hypothetical protein
VINVLLHRKPSAPVSSDDHLRIVPGPDPGPEVDSDALRDVVEAEASGMYDANLGAHSHPLIMEHKIDRWRPPLVGRS